VGSAQPFRRLVRCSQLSMKLCGQIGEVGNQDATFTLRGIARPQRAHASLKLKHQATSRHRFRTASIKVELR
jgi:hypothetical protein